MQDIMWHTFVDLIMRYNGYSWCQVPSISAIWTTSLLIHRSSRRGVSESERSDYSFSIRFRFYGSMWQICFLLLLLCTNNVWFFTLSCCINSQSNLDWQLNISMHNNINVYQYSLIFCILTDHYNTPLKVQFIDWHCSYNLVNGPAGC